MYRNQIKCMSVEDFNKNLVLKKQPIGKAEILKAIAEISLSQNKGCDCNTNAVGSIVGFVNQLDLLDFAIYNYQDDLYRYFLEDYNDKLSIEQLVAINDFCYEYGYLSENDLLLELKKSGVLYESSPLEDLAEQVKGSTYYAMYDYLKGD